MPDIEYSALQALMEGEARATERGAVVWLVGLNPGVLGGRAKCGAGRTTRPRAPALQCPGRDRTLSGVAGHCERLATTNRGRRRWQETRSKEDRAEAQAVKKATSDDAKGPAGKAGVAAPKGEISGKDYARAMKKLHVELVKLQEWVKHKGLKVCIVFEGRDGAGKGGTIKAITERVSPRVFRVVALPAPTEREKSQMYVQRYLPHLPAAGEVVIFDRSWYNRAGVERVMGFCTEEQAEGFLKIVPAVREADGRVRHHPAQVLARGEPGGADAPARGAHRRRPQDLEALADGPQVLQPLVRLLAGARRHVRGDRHRVGAVVRRAIGRQASGRGSTSSATC